MSNALKIGLAVLFTPHHSAGITEQQAATVASVNDDGTVNLTVLAPDGYPYGVQRVPYLTDDDATPADGMYATDAASTKDRDEKSDTSTAEPGNASSTAQSATASAQTEASSGSVGDAGNGSNIQTSQAGSIGTVTGTASVDEPHHETVIERLEGGFEHLKEDVEHVIHHDTKLEDSAT